MTFLSTLDSSGLLGEMRLSRGPTYKMGYSANSQLLHLTLNGKLVYNYAYSQDGNLIDISSPLGNVFIKPIKEADDTHTTIEYR